MKLIALINEQFNKGLMKTSVAPNIKALKKNVVNIKVYNKKVADGIWEPVSDKYGQDKKLVDVRMENGKIKTIILN